MIDEYWTWVFYGYHSDELKLQSNKPIVTRCDNCCKYRIIRMGQYRDLCVGCAHKGIKHPPHPPELSVRISNATKGKKKPHRTKEHRKHLSASHQGIPYEEWTGFATAGTYCEKFDEACRERIRSKYDHRCFVCDMTQEDNGQKLSVHHVDMNKMQGCDGHEWKLVPLCRSHHSRSHGNPLKSRIVFLLDQNV